MFTFMRFWTQNTSIKAKFPKLGRTSQKESVASSTYAKPMKVLSMKLLNTLQRGSISSRIRGEWKNFLQRHIDVECSVHSETSMDSISRTMLSSFPGVRNVDEPTKSITLLLGTMSRHRKSLHSPVITILTDRSIPRDIPFHLTPPYSSLPRFPT